MTNIDNTIVPPIDEGGDTITRPTRLGRAMMYIFGGLALMCAGPFALLGLGAAWNAAVPQKLEVGLEGSDLAFQAPLEVRSPVLLNPEMAVGNVADAITPPTEAPAPKAQEAPPEAKPAEVSPPAPAASSTPSPASKAEEAPPRPAAAPPAKTAVAQADPTPPAEPEAPKKGTTRMCGMRPCPK